MNNFSNIDIFKESDETVVTTTMKEIRKVYDVGHIDGERFEPEGWVGTERPLVIFGAINEGDSDRAFLEINKPISESLETIGVKESQSVSKCIARIMDALDDLAPLIADDEQIMAEVRKKGEAVSFFKGDKFEKTAAVLISKEDDSDEWKTTTCDSLFELMFQMHDRCCGDGES